MSESGVSLLPRCSSGWSFLRHDPLIIGGVALALTLGTTALLGLSVDEPLLGVAFCGTALLYLADRGLGLSPEDRANRPGRGRWFRQHQGWVRAEAVGLTSGLLLLLPLLQWYTIILSVVLGSIGLVYVLPLLPTGRRLKSTGLFKPVSVATAWALGAVILPVVECGEPLTLAVWGLIAYRVLLIVPNVLLADWADREGDAAAGVETWALRWSWRSVQGTSTVLIGMALLGAVVAVGWGAAPLILLLDAFGGVLMGVAVWRLQPEADSLHVLWLDLIVAWPVVDWLVFWGGSLGT